MFRRTSFALAALCLAASAAQAQTVVLVRHAEKAGEAGDPDLSPAGQARAQALAQALAEARVTSVISTPFKRTRQTAAPAAEAAGVPVVAIDTQGGVAAHAARVAAEVRKAPPTAAVLVVGHSNTVPEIARALGDPAPPALTDCDYDGMTVIQLAPGQPPKVVRGRYGAPTPSCPAG